MDHFVHSLFKLWKYNEEYNYNDIRLFTQTVNFRKHQTT